MTLNHLWIHSWLTWSTPREVTWKHWTKKNPYDGGQFYHIKDGHLHSFTFTLRHMTRFMRIKDLFSTGSFNQSSLTGVSFWYSLCCLDIFYHFKQSILSSLFSRLFYSHCPPHVSSASIMSLVKFKTCSLHKHVNFKFKMSGYKFNRFFFQHHFFYRSTISQNLEDSLWQQKHRSNEVQSSTFEVENSSSLKKCFDWLEKDFIRRKKTPSSVLPKLHAYETDTNSIRSPMISVRESLDLSVAELHIIWLHQHELLASVHQTTKF